MADNANIRFILVQISAVRAGFAVVCVECTLHFLESLFIFSLHDLCKMWPRGKSNLDETISYIQAR